MRTKTILTLAIGAIAITSCKKQKNDVIPPKDTATVVEEVVDTSTTISGIANIHLPIFGINNANIQVMRNSGLEEKVTLSVTGVPQTMEVKFRPASGYTSFSSTLRAVSRITPPGMYPITITSTTESGKKRDYKIDLVVDTPTKRECEIAIFNILRTNQFQTRDTSIDSIVDQNASIVTSSQDNEIYLRNMILVFDQSPFNTFRTFNSNSFFHVMIKYDCYTGTATIPMQKIEGRPLGGGVIKEFEIWGTGKADTKNNILKINYTTRLDDTTNPATNSYTLEAELNELN